MLVIGLTGGIGSGKTTVTKLFSEYGVPIIDADLIAREMTEAPKIAWQKIKDYFGPEVLNKDSSLNRQKLRDLIFNDPQKRNWLEQLLHPLIRQEIENKIQELNVPYCIVAIPLLVETGPYPFISRILVVDTSLETQIERLQKRDQAKAEDLLKIIKTQSRREERIAAAQDLIENNGRFDDLQQKIKELHQLYLALSKK